MYSPQIVENYTLQSGEGLSVIFVVTWLLGDLCNLVGAGMAGLQVRGRVEGARLILTPR